MVPDPAAQGLIPSFPKQFSEEKIVNVFEVIQQPSFEDSGLKMLIEPI